MSLPKTPNQNPHQKPKHEAIIVPELIVLGIIAILFISIFIGRTIFEKKPVSKSQAANKLTQTTTVKTADGKDQVVPPEVIQMTPEQLKSEIDAKRNIMIINLVEEGEVFTDPHIKGSFTLLTKSFDNSLNSLTASETHIFVSKDGVDGALVVSKVLKRGLPRDKNFNLAGGLDAWRQKGYEVEK